MNKNRFPSEHHIGNFLGVPLCLDLSRYFYFGLFLKERNEKTGRIGDMFNRAFTWNFMGAAYVAVSFPAFMPQTLILPYPSGAA